MKLRIISALVPLPFVLMAIFWLPTAGFAIMMAIVMGICTYEVQAIVFKKEGYYERVTLAISSVCVACIVFFNPPVEYLYLFVFLIFLVFIIRNLFVNVQGSTVGRKSLRRNFNNMTAVLLMSLYLGVPFILVVRIRNLPNGVAWIFVLLALSWGGDTGAYFFGRSLKKHFPKRLFPLLSPKKTWVGSIGGVIVTLLLFYGVEKFFSLDVPWYHFIIIGILGSAWAQFGDLFESFIKRVYKVKDSGTIMPGHGGLLDRLDALMFCAPWLFWYLHAVYYDLH